MLKNRTFVILFLFVAALLLSVSVPASAAPQAGAQAAAPQPLARPAGNGLAPTACALPASQNIRGKVVDFDQCYETTFSYSGTNYTVDIYYTEQDTTANLGRCTSADYAGRCEHKISNNDDLNGDNVVAVALATEAENTMKFYKDRNLPFLGSGSTFTLYIAEDPRGGGTPTCNSIMVDDEWVDNNDTLSKRLLTFHEMQHLIQCWYQPTPGWDGFYGEGIARAIEDRVNTALDADTGHLFIPEVNGILGSNALRTSDLTTYDYPTVLWWTWLMDQYTIGGETAPVIGWAALRDFYLGVPGKATTLAAVKSFITSKGSTFRKDFTDYSLALYAYRFTTSDARVDFKDAEINSATTGLSGHTVVTGGPAFSTSSVAVSPRSSSYYEFTPASQCSFIGFSFNGGSKAYSFSLITVDTGGALKNRWTNYGTTWARTVSSSGLSRVTGVVTAIDDSGSVSVGRGCITPSINIKNPTSAAFEMVGTSDNPRNFIVRLHVQGADASPVAGLQSSNFQVQVQKAGTTPFLNATIVSSAYVQDDYWLLVRPPNTAAGAVNGSFYNLKVSLGTASDSENSALLYVPRSQDVMIVLDRSGSMGGTTGRIEAARNAAKLFVNELANTDQGGYVAFDTDATLRQALAPVGSGSGSHREALVNSISAEVPLDFTSIGDGMNAAATEHDTHKVAANMCSFVLLSDGYENEPAYWADVRANVVDNGCAIHAVGLGPEANEVLLQSIAASVPGGSYDFADTSGTVPALAGSASLAPDATIGWQNNLSKVYDYKALEVGGRQRIQATFGTGRDQKETLYEFYVDETTQKLVIALAWQNPWDGQILTLTDPGGNVVPVTNAHAPSAGPNAVRRVQPTNEVWEVYDLIPGFYTLSVQNLFQEYYVGFSAESQYQLYLMVGTPVDDLVQGVKVPLSAMFAGPDGGLTGATVVATVFDPNGVVRTLVLLDDGNHNDGDADDGVYGGTYAITGASDMPATNPPEGEEPAVNGSYLVNVTAQWKDVHREAQGSFAIQRSPDDNKNRLPDTWEKLYGVSDPADDPDGDKLTNYCEFQAGTDPLNSDTDGGGQSDGSEVPQCFVDPNGQDPFNPADDRTGGRLGIFVWPLLDTRLNMFVRVWWSVPLTGTLQSTDVYRRLMPLGGDPGPWELVGMGVAGTEYDDFNVTEGPGYQYRIIPSIDTGGGVLLGATEDSTTAMPKQDPYPPGGSVLINNGAATTHSHLVTLILTVDDLYGGQDGPPPSLPGSLSPDVTLPGSPAADIQMRISNSPDFTGVDWVPFQPVVQNWDLGDPLPRGQVSVYVQFMDANGNISQAGFGQVDSILYVPPTLYLPMIIKVNP